MKTEVRDQGSGVGSWMLALAIGAVAAMPYLAFLIGISIALACQGATPVYLPTDQVSGLPLTNVWVQFTPLAYQSYSNRLVTKVPLRVRTDALGLATTNLIAGDYRTEIEHPSVTTAFTNRVPDTNVSVNLAASENMVGAMSIPIADQRYFSVAGSNTVATTNAAGKKVINATGGGSSGGSATNAIGAGYTNGVAAGTGLTEIGFTNGSNTTVSATVAGGRMTVTIQARTTTVSGGNGIWITNQGGTNFVVAGEVTAAQLAAVATLITNYVAGLGYVTSSVTNGLAGKNYVDATFAPINAPTFTGDAIFGGPAQFLSDVAVGGVFSTELTTGTGPYVGYDQANQTFFRTNVPPVGFQVASNGSLAAGSTVTTNVSFDSTQDLTPTVTSNQQSVAVSHSFTGGRTGSGAVMKADSPTGTNGTFKGTVSGAPMTLQPLPGTTNGTLRMMDTNGVVLSLVDSNGNWGIKTTAPTAALDVNGGARFRSGLTNDAASMKFPASTAGYVLTDTTGSGLLTLQPAGIGSGEANVTGEISVTNDVLYRFGLTYDKSGVTNRLRSVQAGYGMAGTNQGTNLIFAVDIAVIASQANLTAASNALHAIILTASNGVYLASAANDITTSNGLHSLLISSSNALNSLIVASSNSLRSTFTAADITTSNGVLTAATAVVNLASNFVWSYANTSSNAFWTLNGVTSNGVYSAAVAVVNLASNALVTLYRADDITTSNGVLVASTAVVNLASNALHGLLLSSSNVVWTFAAGKQFGSQALTNISVNGGKFVDTFWIPASAFTISNESSQATITNFFGKDAIAFADTATNTAVVQFTFPDGWDQGAFRIAAWGRSAGTNSANSNKVVWSFDAYMAPDPSDIATNLYGTATLSTNNVGVSTNQNRFVTGDVTPGGTVSRTNICQLRVARLGGHAVDTETNTPLALVQGFQLYYHKYLTNDAMPTASSQ